MYHKWRTEVRDRPQETMSLILDGMDQAKMLGLNVRVVGCIVHGRPNKVYMFLVTHYTKETFELNGGYSAPCLRRTGDPSTKAPRRIRIHGCSHSWLSQSRKASSTRFKSISSRQFVH